LTPSTMLHSLGATPLVKPYLSVNGDFNSINKEKAQNQPLG